MLHLLPQLLAMPHSVPTTKNDTETAFIASVELAVKEFAIIFNELITFIAKEIETFLPPPSAYTYIDNDNTTQSQSVTAITNEISEATKNTLQTSGKIISGDSPLPLEIVREVRDVNNQEHLDAMKNPSAVDSNRFSVDSNDESDYDNLEDRMKEREKASIASDSNSWLCVNCDNRNSAKARSCDQCQERKPSTVVRKGIEVGPKRGRPRNVTVEKE
jgi:hypothetical protein